MHIVYFGSSDFSLPVLKTLIGNHEICVVTQPDAPAGRGQKLTPNPVAEFCQKNRLPVFKFEKLDEKSLKELIDFLGEKPIIGVCCVYGKIIPKNWLDAFEPKGILNIHPSLLPKYRGPSPAQAAIINNDKETGITIIKMDEKIDHGPILAQFKEKILSDDNAEALYHRLFNLTARNIVNVINRYLNKIPQGVNMHTPLRCEKQDDSCASYTPRLSKSDGFIEWKTIKKLLDGKEIDFRQLPVLKKFPIVNCKLKIENCLSALSPWPGVFTFLKLRPLSSSSPWQQKRLKILSFSFRDGQLFPKQVQMEGKSPVPWQQFLSACEFS